MDIETITKLLDAGYTKDEIKEFESAGNESAENVSAGESESAGNEDAGKEQSNAGTENAGAVNTDAAIKALTETVNALTNTVKAMQTKNAESATGGKPEKNAIEDVMQSFVDSL